MGKTCILKTLQREIKEIKIKEIKDLNKWEDKQLNMARNVNSPNSFLEPVHSQAQSQQVVL